LDESSQKNNHLLEGVPMDKKRIYSIQKHHASKLHFDLRLEKAGVLKSWAIPKEPPKVQGEKRLAIQTEDHPTSFAFFEGEIEEGLYGAGKIEVWDKGTCEEVEWKENKIVIDIAGNKLNGRYVLLRFKPSKNSKNWLFFKKKSASS